MNAAGQFVVRNRTRGTTLAASVRLADTPRSRRIGLLQRETLEPGEGLWIYPTRAIHTFGMRFPIDVAFLDRLLRVKRVYRRLAPFRLTSLVWGARSVLELASGSLDSTGTAVGDELQFSLREELPLAEVRDNRTKPASSFSKRSWVSFAVRGRCRARWAAAAALLTTLTLATGCVRRTTFSQDLGLSGGITPQAARKAAAGSRPIRRQDAAPPDEFLRALFQKPTQGAFNPLTDDRRVQALQTRLRLNPQDVVARLELAGAYENYRFYDDGLEQYAEALRWAGSAPAGSGPLAEQAVLGLGRCARASGRTRQGIPLLEAFLRERPSANSWNELGLLYDELGDFAAGESAFREAVARDAQSDRTHNNLGYNLLLQNKTEAAERELRRALELNPKSTTGRNNLGVLLARRGDLKGALEQFQLASDAATAHNNLAVVLLEAGQYERSREELVKALAMRHYFTPALANFKLVQERMRERAEPPNAGRAGLSAVGVPSALPKPGEVAPPAAADRSPDRQDGAQSKDHEDRQ